MQISLHINVDENDLTDELIESLRVAIDEDEGILIHTGGVRRYVDIDAMEVKY